MTTATPGAIDLGNLAFIIRELARQVASLDEQQRLVEEIDHLALDPHAGKRLVGDRLARRCHTAGGAVCQR